MWSIVCRYLQENFPHIFYWQNSKYNWEQGFLTATVRGMEGFGGVPTLLSWVSKSVVHYHQSWLQNSSVRFHVFYFGGKCSLKKIWLCWVIVVACGIQFPNQELNLGPRHWKCGVTATGLPEKSPRLCEPLNSFGACSFFQPFKNVKPFLAHRVYRHRLWTRSRLWVALWPSLSATVG